ELAEKAAFQHGFADDGFGVEDVTFGFNYKRALGFEIFGYGVGDAVILQIHVTAAPFAHGGFGADGHFEFSAAIEAGNFFVRDRALDRFATGLEDFLDAKMLSALFTDGRDGRTRLALLVAATGADHQHLFL